MKRVVFASLLALAGSVVTVAGCKQGQGDRCQVSDDCEPPLVCNTAKNTCETGTGTGFDADIIDAVPADAAVDAVDAP